MRLSRFIYYYWSLLLLTTGGPVLAQKPAVRQVLLRGQITNNSEKALHIAVDKGLLFERDTARITISGSFQKWIAVPSSFTGHAYISYGTADPLELYLSDEDTVSVYWDGKRFHLSARAEGSPLNHFLIQYQQTFMEQREKTMAQLDSCTSRGSFIEIARALYEQECSFLRDKGRDLDSLAYQRCAYDIFYRNLDMIMSSRFYSNYDFSDYMESSAFPPLLLPDKNTDRLKALSLSEMQRANPRADSSVLIRMSGAAAAAKFRASYSVIDTGAFRISHAYRVMFYGYMEKLTLEMNYRKLGKTILTSVPNYYAWLNSMLEQQGMIDWLVARMIQKKMLIGAARISSAELEKLLAFIHDEQLKRTIRTDHELAYGQKTGAPAPFFSFMKPGRQHSSLEAFRGQYVYIDFWDSNCAPCIHDIQQYSKGVAEKYAGKGIVFLYISLDKEDKEWRRSLEKYAPAGINGRMAEGWDSGVVKDYNIQAIPRHVIVSPDGSFVDAQAPGLPDLFYGDLLKELKL